MINAIFRLIQPRVITIKYEDVSFDENLIIKPDYMALCHADQRYYQGNRDKSVLKKKLPMALCHECVGHVVFDPNGKYKIGDKVALIPNVSDEEKNEIFENYKKNSKFLSSGYDGFMREYISIDEKQVVPICKDTPGEIAAITEFVSVACHGASRLILSAHNKRDSIAVFGDGSLSYTLCCVLSQMMPDSKIIVFGKDVSKLSMFSFVHETYLIDEIPSDMSFDHAFECVGNQSSSYAINDIIKYIKPQGNLMLMGVSETPVPINTRDVLEKGITMIGCSRSGRADFLKAAQIISNKDTQNRLGVIITNFGEVKSILDIHKVFNMDTTNSFKTVFKWSV